MFPWIGKQPIAGITPPQVLEVMRRIEARGVVETAHRALQDSSQVFRYAVATGKAANNPARELKDALRRPNTKRFPAILGAAQDAAGVGGLSGQAASRSAGGVDRSPQIVRRCWPRDLQTLILDLDGFASK